MYIQKSQEYERKERKSMGDIIYLDNAATTAVYPEVIKAMEPYFEKQYGNPSSIYEFAKESKKVIEEARSFIAQALGAKTQEIYFTAGGSESDNWALKGIAFANREKGNHIITSKIEHHAILNTCKFLEENGFEVTYLNVDEWGRVDLRQLQQEIRPTTILISIMCANNEIGTIQPIYQIGQIAKRRGVFFHTDAVQAFGQMELSVVKNQIDLLSASAHKFHGPKGVGFLYIREGTPITSFVHGGEQESGLRAGTHNVPGIIGMKKAAEIAVRNLEKNRRKQVALRNYLIERILREIPYVRLNGDRRNRLSNNANFSFQFVEGESVLVMLDMKGICASSGSACTSSQKEASHVLQAIGLPEELAHGSLRLTLSADTTKEELDFTIDQIKEIINELRSMSPVYEDFISGGREITL